jgi:hypothetical protein
MRQQEINFKCYNCENDIMFEQTQCRICGVSPDWYDTARLDYRDKYLEIFTVYV